MFSKTLVTIVLFLGFCYSNAQECDYVLKGKITDFHDSKPLELAQIYIAQLQKTFISKTDGSYKIDNLCTGTYDISISHYDCETKKITVKILSDTVKNVSLEHHINDLNEVRIVADVHDDHTSTQASTNITSQTIQQYSGASLGDALATVPGITTLKTGNSVVKPIVHGLYGSRVTIVNDGLRQQDQEWGVEHAPNIDVNTASNIQIIKGASALRYGGDAVGGTIIIEPTRVISKDTLKGHIIAQGQTNGRGGSITSTINNFKTSGWYEQATLTYKRLGDFESPDYILSNTGSETAAVNFTVGFKQFEYGASLKYSFYDTEIGILRASHIGNAADLVTSINSGQPTIINDFTYDINAPKQAVQHHGIQLNTFKRFAGLGKLDLDYAFQFNNRKEFDIRRGANAGRASLDIDLQTHTLASHLLIDSIDKVTLQMGIDGFFQLNAPDADTGVRRLIPDYNAFKVGAFTSILYEPIKNWVFDAGLRYDYYKIDAQKFYLQSRWESLGYDTQFSQFEVEQQGNQILTNPVLNYNLLAFTAGAKHIFSDHYDLSINLSTASRAPNPSELFSDGLHHALATIELGSLELEKEKSYKINTTFHVNQGKFDFEINPYVNFVDNFIQLVPTGIETTTRGAFPVFEYEQINARLYGVDLSASYDFWIKKIANKANTNPNEIVYQKEKLLSINSNFSYVHGSDTSNTEALIDMPPAQLQNNLVWYNILNTGIELTVSHEYVWQQTRFPDNDYNVRVPLDNGSFETRTVQISQPPNAYSLWNAGVSYAFAKARLTLSTNNLLNTNYRNYLNRQRFYADEVGRDIQIQFTYNF